MTKIAILVPSYNCEPYVEATLESLMSQGPALSHVDRVILTDDCSQDRTVDVARSVWKASLPLEIFQAAKNRGEYQNMNEAVSRLPNDVEWFLIMHADNLAKPGWLEALIERISIAGENTASICTSWDDLMADGRIVPGENRQPPIPELIGGDDAAVAGTLEKGCWWHISSCAIRVKSYREVGGLPLGLRLKGDWDFLLRILGSGLDIEYLPRSLMTYRTNMMGSSSITFRSHRDVFETLTVLHRHHYALSFSKLLGYHGSQLKTLARRWAGGILRGNYRRSIATFPMALFALGSLSRCIKYRALGRRRFDWVSSTDSMKQSSLGHLSTAMKKFYSQPATRKVYQQMIDDEASSQPATETALRKMVLDVQPCSVLEVGCGSGRIYERLRAQGYENAYTGVEMSPQVIKRNRERFPEAEWLCSSAYDLTVPDSSQDCVYAYYVLEHCVFPQRFLEHLLRVVKPGGSLILAFPDFSVAGIFGSQRLGLAEGNARDHLKAGRPLSAMVALYDSRIRLRRALRNTRKKVGPFPVNVQPKCLDKAVQIVPDVDAVYLASCAEIVEWARENELEVAFPPPETGILPVNVLIKLRKSVSDGNGEITSDLTK